MTGAQPADKCPPGMSALAGNHNLMLRVLSSLVMAPLAIAAVYAGGMVFVAFWAVAAVIVLWEWSTLVCQSDRGPVLGVGGVAIVGTVFMFVVGRTGVALALIALGALGAAALAPAAQRKWCAAGVVYAGVILMASVLLRRGEDWGLWAILFLFAIVWLTDIAAYFGGRAIGGPKLMPRISPNKTWAGAVGGTFAGVAGGIAVAHAAGISALAVIGLIALALSVASQVGDLLESAMKRHFHAKDASGLIPGHGGLMDRLDGYTGAVFVGALIGIAHGGTDAAARGLMIW
jgi:phosphatidate cytidylyltransferase